MDSANCFENAYFYLANIYLMQNNPEQARLTLFAGKIRYSNFGNDVCTPDIIQRFDAYLERMSPDSSLAPSIFVAYDEAPATIGGLAAIQRNLEYPQDAIEMEVEGTVILHILIDCFGHVCITKILLGAELPSMDIAARKAVKLVMWEPALQRNKPVRVWVSIPVVFKLN